MTIDPELEAKLSGILDKRDERDRRAAEKKAVEKSAAEIYLERFKKARADLIRPALKEIGTALEARGLWFELRDEAARKERDNYSAERLRFDFYDIPKSKLYGMGQGWPGLWVSCDERGEYVSISESTIGPGRGGSSGGGKSYKLEEITPELLHGIVVELVGKVLATPAYIPER